MTHESMGKRIQRLRRERGLTQEQAAEALGVTAAAVSKWETTAASRTFLLGSFRQALAEDETFRPLRRTRMPPVASCHGKVILLFQFRRLTR